MDQSIRLKTVFAARCWHAVLLTLFSGGAVTGYVHGDDRKTVSSENGLAPSTPAAPAPYQSEQLAMAFADLIRDAIPLEYERKKNWGKTKRIPVGIKNIGHGLHLRLRKREKVVKHGVWTHYRVTLVDPDDNLRIRIENLHPIRLGRVGSTLHFEAKLHGWARTKVYNRGIHVISMTGEGETKIHLEVDCDVGVRLEPATVLAGIVVDPVVNNARLKLSGFRLERVGELDGPLARELSSGLRHLIEDKLEPAKLTKKLNRAIDKKRDRLRFTPDKYLSSGWATLTASRPAPEGGHGVKVHQSIVE
jgi:hypothetical protein